VLQRSFLVLAVLTLFCESFAYLDAMKFDEVANFIFVQLIGQEPYYVINATMTTLGRIK
jgi:hypothetical protein